MQGDCINCGQDAEGRFDVALEGDEALSDVPLCSGCAAELDTESFIEVAQRARAMDRNK